MNILFILASFYFMQQRTVSQYDNGSERLLKNFYNQFHIPTPQEIDEKKRHQQQIQNKNKVKQKQLERQSNLYLQNLKMLNQAAMKEFNQQIEQQFDQNKQSNSYIDAQIEKIQNPNIQNIGQLINDQNDQQVDEQKDQQSLKENSILDNNKNQLDSQSDSISIQEKSIPDQNNDQMDQQSDFSSLTNDRIPDYHKDQRDQYSDQTSVVADSFPQQNNDQTDQQSTLQGDNIPEQNKNYDERGLQGDSISDQQFGEQINYKRHQRNIIADQSNNQMEKKNYQENLQRHIIPDQVKDQMDSQGNQKILEGDLNSDQIDQSQNDYRRLQGDRIPDQDNVQMDQQRNRLKRDFIPQPMDNRMDRQADNFNDAQLDEKFDQKDNDGQSQLPNEENDENQQSHSSEQQESDEHNIHHTTKRIQESKEQSNRQDLSGLLMTSDNESVNTIEKKQQEEETKPFVDQQNQEKQDAIMHQNSLSSQQQTRKPLETSRRSADQIRRQIEDQFLRELQSQLDEVQNKRKSMQIEASQIFKPVIVQEQERKQLQQQGSKAIQLFQQKPEPRNGNKRSEETVSIAKIASQIPIEDQLLEFNDPDMALMDRPDLIKIQYNDQEYSCQKVQCLNAGICQGGNDQGQNVKVFATVLVPLEAKLAKQVDKICIGLNRVCN